MTKKKLFMGETKDERSFLEKLTVAYAPIDDMMLRASREIAKANAVKNGAHEADTSDRKYGLGVKFAVRHLGSV
ncbi:MAG: hypothetical protein JJ850_09460 [Kordiimonadaceae bacterium]|nr:hypothetical protein [Kordiimonadaceae bacterium]MBO6569357.1 hypothetical protein [Kordiimonadaceae bacterium]MBO6964832.1 hypothetical protein [Kordiimonadaceae bacterium]